jgi:alanine racemase
MTEKCGNSRRKQYYAYGVTLKRDKDLFKGACKTEKPLKIHIKIDSGMNRLGAQSTGELQSMLDYIRRCGNIKLCGIYTHFADCRDTEFTEEQYGKFIKFVNIAKSVFPILRRIAPHPRLYLKQKVPYGYGSPGYKFIRL